MFLAAPGKVIGGKPGIFQAGATTQLTGTKSKGVKAPQFTQKLNSINARQGENINFVAEIDGDPFPTVQWQFNGRPLVSSGNHIVILSIYFYNIFYILKISLNGNKVTLEITKATANNAGSYICTIRNSSGAAQCEAKLAIQSR